MRSHAEHSTTSEGKLRSEAFITRQFNPTEELAPGFMLGVVGCADGAARHVTTWETQGYPETRQIMIDRDLPTFEALLRWKFENNYHGRVIHGTFEELLPQLRAEGLNITAIDADVCGHWGPFEERMIQAVIQARIPRLALTFTIRGYTQYHEELGYRLGIIPAERITSGHYRTPRNRRRRIDHYPFRLLIEQHCKAIIRQTPEYRAEYFSYRSMEACNMATVCISK